MNVRCLNDGRVFNGNGLTYQPGDAAWFDEDVMLVVAIKGDTAIAVEHPAAREMRDAALNFGPKGPAGAREGLDEAARIHAFTVAKMANVAGRHAKFDAISPGAILGELNALRRLYTEAVERVDRIEHYEELRGLSGRLRDAYAKHLSGANQEAIDILRADLEEDAEDE